MKKNTLVSWQVINKEKRGHGVVITDEDSTGHVQVAVHDLYGEPQIGYHPVIWCTVTWLTVEAP